MKSETEGLPCVKHWLTKEIGEACGEEYSALKRKRLHTAPFGVHRAENTELVFVSGLHPPAVGSASFHCAEM